MALLLSFLGDTLNDTNHTGKASILNPNLRTLKVRALVRINIVDDVTNPTNVLAEL